MDIQNKLIEKINDGFLIAFANHLFDNYVKMGDYYHLKGEVYWNTSRKSIDELLIDYKKEYKDIENIKKIDISFESIFKDKQIKEEFTKEGLKEHHKIILIKQRQDIMQNGLKEVLFLGMKKH